MPGNKMQISFRKLKLSREIDAIDIKMIFLIYFNISVKSSFPILNQE